MEILMKPLKIIMNESLKSVFTMEEYFVTLRGGQQPKEVENIQVMRKETKKMLQELNVRNTMG